MCSPQKWGGHTNDTNSPPILDSALGEKSSGLLHFSVHPNARSINNFFMMLKDKRRYTKHFVLFEQKLI